MERLHRGQACVEDGKSMAGDVMKPQQERAPILLSLQRSLERGAENDFLLGNSFPPWELFSSFSACLTLTHPFDSDEYHLPSKSCVTTSWLGQSLAMHSAFSKIALVLSLVLGQTPVSFLRPYAPGGRGPHIPCLSCFWDLAQQMPHSRY